MIAKQLDKLARIFPPEVVFQILFPISLKLCNDIVAEVRSKAAKKMYALLEVMKPDDEGTEIYRTCIAENLRAFSLSNRFTQRQTQRIWSQTLASFASMCSNFMRLPDFEEAFLPAFAELAGDRVTNVRITVALTLRKHLTKGGGLFKQHPVVRETIQKLCDDKSQTVASILVESESVREKLKAAQKKIDKNL